MSSSEMPELGSKITLISNADIRYEGKLYTVDPQDCTIALASVKSFGTEDRKTGHQFVPAQNQIYDYILFRATDIKDISVVPTTELLYDPAIVQLSAPSRFPGPGLPRPSTNDSFHQVGGNMPGVSGNHFGGFAPLQPGMHSSLVRPSPSEFLHQGNTGEHAEKPKMLLPEAESEHLLTGSRSSSPRRLFGGKPASPTIDQSTQAGRRNSPPKDDQRNRQNSGSRDNNRQVNRNNDRYQQMRPRSNYQQNSYQQPNYHQQGNQMRGPRNNQQGQQGQQRGRQGGWNQNRNQQQQQQPQQQRQNFQRAPGARVKPQPLKFESDYDFEKYNTEFEDLKNELSKMKIDGAAQPAVIASPVVNGEEKKEEDSGNEAAANNVSNTEAEQTAEEQYFYNKTKSFFDNISCEAVERSKGSIQRTDWRKERKLNTETFGFPAPRRGGMYRGNAPMGGSFYYRGARGGHNYGRGNNFRHYRQPKPIANRQNQQQPQAANA